MKQILVALDGSPRAAGVLAKAVGIARSQGGRLLLLRAVRLPPDIAADFSEATDGPRIDRLEERARAYLDGQIREVPPELFGRAEVVIGPPWKAICDTARRFEVDLIVIGAHGYDSAESMLGTTAARVVNHASVSVLVTREP
ncbi:MAG TPA: universal stress protein [Polyangiaceae bacterium]|jgi:nucleotide-binding universal stress UspA family protein